MSEKKVRRLPVINKNKRLVGIISLGDIALADGPDSAGPAICGISEPGGKHSQSDGRNAGPEPPDFSKPIRKTSSVVTIPVALEDLARVMAPLEAEELGHLRIAGSRPGLGSPIGDR